MDILYMYTWMFWSSFMHVDESIWFFFMSISDGMKEVLFSLFREVRDACDVPCKFGPGLWIVLTREFSVDRAWKPSWQNEPSTLHLL